MINLIIKINDFLKSLSYTIALEWSTTVSAFSFITVLNNGVILLFSFCRGDQIKGRAAYFFSMSDLQDAYHLLKKWHLWWQ